MMTLRVAFMLVVLIIITAIITHEINQESYNIYFTADIYIRVKYCVSTP